jgi:hypothetical protein
MKISVKRKEHREVPVKAKESVMIMIKIVKFIVLLTMDL